MFTEQPLGSVDDPPADWVPPQWWPDVTAGTRPVVVVSQGSIRPDVTELLVPAIRGLAEQDVLVVGTVPANVRITRFIPYDLLLARTRVFVHNGGYSGVTLALAHGVPLVQAGTTEEKVDIAARIEWSGVGVKLGTTRQTPEAVREGVLRVLREPGFAAAAARMHQEMAGHDAGREGADLLEMLVVTKRPVLRSDLRAPSDGAMR